MKKQKRIMIQLLATMPILFFCQSPAMAQEIRFSPKDMHGPVFPQYLAEAEVNWVTDSDDEIAVELELENGIEPEETSEIEVTGIEAAEADEAFDLAVVAEADADIELFADSASSRLTGEELSEIRGAFSPNNANLNILEGIAAHNNVLNSVTGRNVISEGSFDGTSGMVNVIQNSGNNTVIQSATIVNLSFE